MGTFFDKDGVLTEYDPRAVSYAQAVAAAQSGRPPFQPSISQPTMNPMNLGAPLPHSEQPGDNPAATQNAPPPSYCNVVPSTVNYQQPSVITPPARPGTTPTAANPMGL